MSDLPSTEAIPPQSCWLDQLDDAAAVAVMLESQAEAAKAVKAAAVSLEQAAAAIHQRLAASTRGRLVYAGAGTSIRIGVQDGVELVPTFGWPRERLGFVIAGGEKALMQAVEGAEDDATAAMTLLDGMQLGADDVLIGIAASGRTPFTCQAVSHAACLGALTIALANTADAPVFDAADHAILLSTGAEAIAGSTRLKAGTAQKISLNMLSTLVMVRLGLSRGGVMSALAAGGKDGHATAFNEKLAERSLRIAKHLKKLG